MDDKILDKNSQTLWVTSPKNCQTAVSLTPWQNFVRKPVDI